MRDILSATSPLQANKAFKRLAQETLSGLEHILVQLKVEVVEDSADYERQLHLGNVATHACAGTVAEGNEGCLLQLGDFLPSLGTELVGVGSPDLLAVVDGVGGDGKYSLGWPVTAADVCSTGWHDARETERGGGVDTHGFLDDHLDIGQVLDLLEDGDILAGRYCSVNLLLQLLDNFRVLETVEEEGAGCVGGCVGAGNQLGQSFSSKFFAVQLLSFLVLALHEAAKKIDTVGRVIESLLDTGNGDTL